MKHTFYLLFLVGLFPILLQAQELQKANWCGTEWTPEVDAIAAENARQMHDGLTPRNVDYNVPLRMHLVAKTDGTGRIEKHKVLDALCGLIEEYGNMSSEPANYLGQTPNGNIKFYLKETFGENINFDNYYDAPDANTMSTCMSTYNVANRCNVYINNNAYVGTGGGDVLGVYIGARDALIFQKSEVVRASETFQHEIGHYFTLPHPFFGMEAALNAGTLENQYDATTKCMLTSVNHEYVPRSGAQSNCTTAADRFCDTPASWGEGYGNPGCTYTGPHKDRYCNQVDPDETNIMDYYIGCANHFSVQQINTMLTDCNSTTTRPNGTRRNMTSQTGYNTNVTTAPTTITSPTAGVGAGTSNITVSWTPVANADYYILQVSRLVTYASSVLEVDKMFTSATTSYTIPSLSTANRNYYLRVFAFSNSQFCNIPTAQITFLTYGVGVSEIDYVDHLNVVPNPVSSGTNININIQSTQAFAANAEIFNMNGQSILNEKLNFEMGENTRQIETATLPKGMYILKLTNEKGALKQTKFIVQ